MLVRGPNYIGRAVQTEQNKRNVASCWRISDRFQTMRNNLAPNNTQQHATGCANGRNM